MNLSNEELISVIEWMIESKINEIPIKEGKRGLKGRPGQKGEDGIDGKDFSFENSKKEILQLLIENKDKFKGDKGEDGKVGPRGLRGLNGKDGKNGLNGLNGKDGKDGKSLKWEEAKQDVLDYFVSEFKLLDLTQEDLNLIRGPRGFRGQKGKSGKDFVWEENSEKIRAIIEKESLTFEKLTEEQKEELKGARGPRGFSGKAGSDGKDGKDFIWEEHDSKIKEHLDTLKLKFEDLSKEEIELLRGPKGAKGTRGRRGEKGEKGDTGLAGVPGLRGLTGEKGRDGKDGLDGVDGVDGLDAPAIVDIELKEWNDKFYFVFVFDNGNRIETKKIEKPVISQMVQQIVAGGGGGHRCYQSTNIVYDAKKRASVVRNYLDVNNAFMGRKEEIVYDGEFVDHVIESVWSAEGPDENSPNKLIVEKKVDLIYLNNFVTDIKVIDV